jgi:hypothetical protein
MKKNSFRKGSGSNYHTLQCKYCGEHVAKCDINTVKVTCFRCTHKLVEGNVLEERK